MWYCGDMLFLIRALEIIRNALVREQKRFF